MDDIPFLKVCLALMTLGVWIGLAFLIFTLLQLRHAAQAVEVVIYQLDDNLAQIREASHKLGDFASAVRSKWMRLLEAGIGAAAALWPERKQAAGKSGDGGPDA